MKSLPEKPVAAGQEASRYRAEDVKVRMYGDTALVQFRLVQQTHEGAHMKDTARFLNSAAFLKRNGRWQATLWQAVRIPEDPANSNPTNSEGKKPAAKSTTAPTGGRFSISARAYRVVPEVHTSYYSTPGSGETDCLGEGSDLGGFTQFHISCTSTYSPAQQAPITWRTATVYNVVTTHSERLLIACRANTRWSKCTYLIPGQDFVAERKDGRLVVLATVKGKERRIKYDVLASEPLR
jgi:hypothetical protein